MQENNVIYLQSVLEGMPTQQLADILNRELDREEPNDVNVRMVLKILHEREEDVSDNMDPETEIAWAEYLTETGGKEEPTQRGRNMLRVAIVVLVTTVLLLTLPQSASAKNFFERFVVWTDSVLALISNDDSGSISRQYVFTTDNPGLQQVYDVVTELGITEPVVPMWLPEGYVLTECKAVKTLTKNAVSATFSKEGDDISLRVNVYSDNILSAYYKNDGSVEYIEMSGIEYMLARNNNRLVVVWMQENIECSISADCQEDELLAILKSIYTMEDD